MFKPPKFTKRQKQYAGLAAAIAAAAAAFGVDGEKTSSVFSVLTALIPFF